MKNKLFIAACVALFSAAAASAAPVKITASIDSTVVEMGSRAVISVNVNDPSHKAVAANAPEDGADMGAFDVVSHTTDTTAAGYVTNYTIQAFIPGMATIGPFKYVIGGDTVESDVVTLKVLPVELDSLETINPMEGAVNPPRKWYDFIPDWTIWIVIGLALAAIIAAAIFMYIQYRKTGTVLMHKPKPIDPYEEAMEALNKLRERHLPENGKDKEYYTSLVDILRQYLQRRFSINAMEMSSTQILASLRSNPETRDNQPRIKQILEIADFVKFAKVRPLPDDNVKSYNIVVNFVETTKPVPEPDEKDNKTTKLEKQ